MFPVAYQILQRENPATIASVRSVLEKNSWYEAPWKSQLEKLPPDQRDKILFMLAARWADDIRTLDKAQSRLPWHYVDFPFTAIRQSAKSEKLPEKSEKFFTFHLYQRANRPNQKGASGQVDDLGRQHIAKRLRIVALGIDLCSS
jgi:hypothetical protein